MPATNFSRRTRARTHRPPGRRAPRRSAAFTAGALLLGVAASGFFDGIVLHQLLQWHHLLSGLAAPDWANVERQIMADGWFHALMYALAAVALGLLWRDRASLAAALRVRSLATLLLWGFGLWNVADALLFHWLLGLHRVRMDSPQPLTWDLAWLLLTGLLPIGLAWRLGRASDEDGRNSGNGGNGGNSGNGGSGGSGGNSAGAPAAPPASTAPTASKPVGILWRLVPARPGPGAAPAGRRGLLLWSVLSALTFGAAAWSARPLADAPMLLVFYPSGTPGASAMAGVDAVGGRVIDMNPDGTVWALALPRSASRLPLFLHGARAVAEVPAWAGCAQRLRLGG